MPRLTKTQKHQEEQYSFPYHYLDLASEHYKLFSGIEYLNLLDTVKDALHPFNNQLILDAGCGDGRLCFELKREKVTVVGVDYSQQAINFAKAFNPDVEFFIQDLEQLNLPYKFDQIVLMETLEHLIPDKIPNILKNLSNILKKNGRLIITVPTWNHPFEEKHYQHFTKESLDKTIQPYFKISMLSGFSKSTGKRFPFRLLRLVCYTIYPFGNKINLFKKFFNFLNTYYKKHLSIGKPEECYWLVAVCIKND